MSGIIKMNRRVFLRGAGTVLALPALEWALPKKAFASDSLAPKRLFVFFYPNGMNMPEFTPAGEGSSYTMSRILEPLAPYRDDLLVISGLASEQSEGGDPHLPVGGLLTGVPVISIQQRQAAGPYSLDNPDYGISMDQVIARAIGNQTPYASLELGLGSADTDCGSAFDNTEFSPDDPDASVYVSDCAYMWNVSFDNITSPRPKETNPLALLNRLFGGSIGGESAAQQKQRRYSRKSVLDYVMDSMKSLNGKVGVADQRRLDEYATGLFEVEQRLTASSISPSISCAPTPSELAAFDLTEPLSLEEKIKATLDLAALAFRCDLTRVSSFMLGNGRSERIYPQLGIYAGHHGISHHQNNKTQLELLSQIGLWEMGHLAYFVGKLKEMQELDGSSVLDNSMVLGCSAIGNSDAHTPWDLPVVMLGQGGGAFAPGRHISYPVAARTPIANLHISIMQAMGVEISEFGLKGTGPLQELS